MAIAEKYNWWPSKLGRRVSGKAEGGAGSHSPEDPSGSAAARPD
jgi:hypothetical protein